MVGVSAVNGGPPEFEKRITCVWVAFVLMEAGLPPDAFRSAPSGIVGCATISRCCPSEIGAGSGALPHAEQDRRHSLYDVAYRLGELQRRRRGGSRDAPRPWEKPWRGRNNSCGYRCK